MKSANHLPYRSKLIRGSLRTLLISAAGTLAFIKPAVAETIAPAPPAPRLHWRHPAALVAHADRLYVANHRGGTLSRIQLSTHQVLPEKRLGRSLSDLVRLPDGRLLASDEAAGQIVVFRERDEQIVVEDRVDVAASPVSIAVAPGGRMASVASLWARRLTLLTTEDDVRVARVIDLPFAPRLQIYLPNGRHVIVADAFGGRLGIVDVEQARLAAVRTIDAHNIRGLTVDVDRQHLLIAHQMLTSNVPTTHSRVSWGQVVSNLLRGVPVSELLPQGADQDDSNLPPARPVSHWYLEPLGEQGNAAGDPAAIVVTPSGGRVVCLSGVRQVAIAKNGTSEFRRVDVGMRPTALAMDPTRPWLYVANTHDDSISVIDVASMEVTSTIALGPRPELSVVDRGERYFHDARLSLDGWFSCHSCHTDGHTNGLLNDNFGDGLPGTPKRVPSLLGTNRTGPWGWNGQHFWLNTQVSKSLATTMRSGADTEELGSEIVSAVTDYLRSLPPPPSLSRARGQAIDEVARGKAIFEQQDCARCHAPPVYTTPDIFDVGLEDEAGRTEFNPPSLLGVSQLNAWFHDNRARSLEEVFTRWGHPHGATLELDDQEVRDLVAFLRAL